MRLRAACFLLFVLSSIATTSFAQNPPLDIVFEGPWMFYPEDFEGNKILVAIAPDVPGHHMMSFSTGDGGTVPFGTYCLIFDNAPCKGIGTTIFTSSTKPNPVILSRPSKFDWKQINKSNKNAYVLILPMPKTYSSDGMYGVTFQDSFPQPSPSPTPISTVKAPYSIGLILHYNDNPPNVKLNGCSTPPSSANCNQPTTAKQPNVAPLHIAIKSSDAPDICDYHVHRAYHKMIKLLESMGGGMTTKTLRFVDVPVYRDDCSPCDPQQDTVSSDCTAMAMTMTEADKATAMSVSTVEASQTDEVAAINKLTQDVGQLVKILGSAPADLQGCIRLPQLKKQQGRWENTSFPFITLSDLRDLELNLTQSEDGIRTLLSDHACSVENNAFKKTDVQLSPENLKILNTARAQEQALRSSIQPVYVSLYDAISGKNCRVTEMLVQ